MFLKRNRQQRRDKAIGLDLGTSQVKAAVVQRRGDKVQLAEYAVDPLPADISKRGGQAQFAEHLQAALARLNTQERRAFVTISCSSAMVCQAEFPRMPLEEVKSALKLNSARYLRRDFSNYYLDAVEVLDFSSDAKGKKSPKMQVLVGGANKDEVGWYRDALTVAKIRPEVMELAAVSVVNAFQLSHAELCENEIVLVVDIGGRSTTINFLRQGVPVITRIMHFGGYQLSEYIGQMLTLETTAAEQEKVRMSEPVQALVRTAISPLARELRSSIDFFERQHERHVGRAFACGGSACSAALLDLLSEVVGIRIEQWNPVETFETGHFNGEGAKLAALAPTLAAAIGAAAARL